mmetsp:Transcript_21722/g.43975  ORF Transcript_21722/g.43975 Transcript_21722/m.43975 type:complete len:103 (-) Transcript_21722:104-412(-)
MELERRRLAEGFRAGFEEGATVSLQGLRSAPELNGKRAKLVAWNSQSLRWQVELEDDGGSKALNPTNLVPVCDGQGRGKKVQREEEEEAPEGEPEEKRARPE